MKLKIRRPYGYETGQLAVQEQEYTGHTLYHHGILGMKWGRKNGPPYPLGPGDHSSSERKAGWRKSLDNGTPKRKRAADMTDEELISYNKRKNLEQQYNKLSGQDKTGLEVTKNTVDTVLNTSRQLSNSFRGNNNQKPQRERMDLSDKSDKELRDAISRENLEIQYSNLFGPEKKATGKQKVAQFMDTAGDTLTLASAALSIAIGVAWLKKNGVF